MGKETENKNETLDNFEGFENTSEINFFGEAPVEENSAEDVLSKIEKEDTIQTEKKENVPTKEDGKDSKKEEPKEPEIAFFEEDLDTEETIDTLTDKNEEPDDDKPKTSSSIEMLTKLKEKGLVDYELEEGQELTDEIAEEILEDGFDDAVENTIGEKLKGLPDSVKSIVKYAMDGGNVEEFISKLKEEPGIKLTKDMDLDDEDNQMSVVRLQKQAEGEDSETTEAYIEFLKESGKLKGVSEKLHSKLIERKDKLTQEEAKRQAKIKAESKKNERKFKQELTSFINEAEDLNGLPLSKKERTSLPGYMSEKISLDDGRVTTQMHHDLYNALQDKEKAVLLAKLLHSDFDFSSIAKAEKTKYTKEVKNDLTRSRNNTTRKASGLKKKSLAEYF